MDASGEGGFRVALFAVRVVIAVTALRESLCLIWSSNRVGQRRVSEMSCYQAARIGFRARWLAVELAFYLLALLTLGAQIACLLASSPT